MSNNDFLRQYIDGELDSVGEDVFFSKMSGDRALRSEFEHHIEIDHILGDIMQAWASQFPKLDQATRDIALQRFRDIRKISRLSKKPSAAELLLWLSVLSAQQITAEQLAKPIKLADLPALLCLIKDHTDYRYLEN